MRSSILTGIGGVAAAFLGSLCCVGPLLFVTLGIGAGLASTFEPLRPVFGMLMLVVLAVGFWAVYGRRTALLPRAAVGRSETVAADAACAPASACAAPARRGRDVAILWSATVVAIVLWTFPTWSLWLL
jgi:mercuric ion transport protein